MVHKIAGKEETIEQSLVRISGSQTSSEADDKTVEYVYRELLGMKNARVVGGILYPVGSGRPYSIQEGAKTVLEVLRKMENK